MAIVKRAADFIKSVFGRGGGRGSNITSQNRAARMGKSKSNKAAVRLPSIRNSKGGKGAKGGTTGGTGG